MTMRRPTSPEEAYRWHTKALAANGDRSKMPPIHENQPQPGWYMRRVVKDGPYVAARIWIEADVEDGELLGPERLMCEVDGRPATVGSQWTWLASRPITEDKYMEILARGFTMEPDPEPVGTPAPVPMDGAPEDRPPPPKQQKGGTLF